METGTQGEIAWRDLGSESDKLEFTSRDAVGKKRVAILREKTSKRILACLPILPHEVFGQPQALLISPTGELGKRAIRMEATNFMGIRELDQRGVGKENEPISTPTTVQWATCISLMASGGSPYGAPHNCAIWSVSGEELEMTTTDHPTPENIETFLDPFKENTPQ